MRVPFEQALEGFREFLRGQGWSDDLLWLSRDRITGFRRRFWILRPTELVDPDSSRRFYTAACRTDSSIRLDGFCSIDGKTLAYVHDYGGASRFLNFGVLLASVEMTPVPNWFQLWGFKVWSMIRGGSPFLKHTRITPKTQNKSA